MNWSPGKPKKVEGPTSMEIMTSTGSDEKILGQILQNIAKIAKSAAPKAPRAKLGLTPTRFPGNAGILGVPRRGI